MITIVFQNTYYRKTISSTTTGILLLTALLVRSAIIKKHPLETLIKGVL